MKRLVVIALLTAMMVPAVPASAADSAPARAAQVKMTGGIRGTAISWTGRTPSTFNVQLRNLQTGQLAGFTTSNATGHFNFIGLNPGYYVAEVLSEAGAIVGSSSPVTVTTGAISAVTISASAGGASQAPAVASGPSTALIVTVIAAAAGIAAAVAIAVNGDSSPSR
jgi:hypothetical protein